MRIASLAALVALVGCSRADERSLRRVIEDRFRLYVDSRDHFAIDRCSIAELPTSELNWFRVKYPLQPRDRLPPVGRCSLRFNFDLGHGQRETMTREVQYVFVEGAWLRWRDEPPVR